MMDGIEKTLGLLPLVDIDNDKDDENQIEITENSEHSSVKSNKNFLDVDYVKHDLEITDIQQKAIDAYEILMAVGQNVDPIRSARLFEVAGQFLKTAQDTTNDKLKRDIDIVKLKIAAKKLEYAEGISGILEAGTEIMADRNEIIKQMIQKSQGPIIDGDVTE